MPEVIEREAHGASTPAPRFRRVTRIAGPLFLTVALVLLWREGYLFTIRADAIAWAFGLSVVSVLFNGFALKSSVEIFGRELSARRSLQLAAIGSLGNTVGAPVGSGYKYLVLVRRCGLRVGQLVKGQLLLTFFFFVAFGVVLTALLGFGHQGAAFAIPAVVVAFAVLLYLVARFAPALAERLEMVSAAESAVARMALTVFLNALLMVALYVGLVLLQLDAVAAWDAAVYSTTTLLVGFATGMPYLGGLQETVMGLAGMAYSVEVLASVTVVIIVRIGSLLAASFVWLTVGIYSKARGEPFAHD